MLPEINNSGVPNDAMRELVSVYESAIKRINQLVLTPKGNALTAQNYNRIRAYQLAQQIDQILHGLDGRTREWIKARMPQAAREGLAQALRYAKEIDPKTGEARWQVGRSFSQIDQGAVSVLADQMARDLHNAAKGTGERAKDLIRRTGQLGLSEHEINKIIAGGIIEGSPRETIRQLRDELIKVHGDTVVAGSKEIPVKQYAEMVVRTKTRQAVQISRHRTLQRIGIKTVVVIGKQSNNFCSAFLGQIFTIDGDDPNYPPLSSLPGGGPPFHPNCSKSTRPIVVKLADPDQLDRGQRTADTDTMIGKTPTQAQRMFRDSQMAAQVKGRLKGSPMEYKPRPEPSPKPIQVAKTESPVPANRDADLVSFRLPNMNIRG